MRSLRLRTLGLLLPGLALVPMLPAAGGAPFITDDTGTPGLGHWEFNLVAIHERCDGACSTELPMFDMSYGPTERIQLNYVVSNSIAHEDVGGGGHARAAGAKARLAIPAAKAALLEALK